MRLPYREGTWFAVPLKNGDYAVGVVARATATGKVILCYFFGPRRSCVPELPEVEHLKPTDAVKVIRVGDLGLIEGSWPVIGESSRWDRSGWRMPAFVRSDPFSRKSWRVEYSDLDPLQVQNEQPEPYGPSALERDSVFGSGAAELVLDHILS